MSDRVEAPTTEVDKDVGLSGISDTVAASAPDVDNIVGLNCGAEVLFSSVQDEQSSDYVWTGEEEEVSCSTADSQDLACDRGYGLGQVVAAVTVPRYTPTVESGIQMCVADVGCDYESAAVSTSKGSCTEAEVLKPVTPEFEADSKLHDFIYKKFTTR